MDFDFETVPHHWINRLGFLIRRELQTRFRRAGADVTAEEWAVLLLLWRRDGRSPGMLADRTIRDRTTMTRLLDGMERKGLVLRQTDADDRRRMQVWLTTSGREIRDVLLPVARDLIGQTMDGIPQQDVETSLRVLRRMTGNLQPNGG